MDVDISNIFKNYRGKLYINIDNYKFSEYHRVKMSGYSNFRLYLF